MTYLISVLTFGTIWAILVVSLNVLVGYAGQVSLGHAALFGVGAYTMALATTRYELPFLVGVVLAIVITAAVSGFLGLPSLRVQHDFLVLATIGFNFIVAGVFSYVEFFGGALGIVGIPPPAIGGLQVRGVAFLAVCLAGLAVVAWLSHGLRRTWGGLGLLALREDQTAAESVGVGHAFYKISAFVISGAVAGLGGALYAPFVGNVFPDRFSFIESIILMSMLIFGGIGTIHGAILGGFVLKALPEYLRFGGTLRFALYGAILLLVILLQPQGLFGEDAWLTRNVRRLWRRLRPGEVEPATTEREDVDIDVATGETGKVVLEIRNAVVEFDGLRALDGAHLQARRGEVLGLIGPNGAGKTTLFNAITGMVPLSEGRIVHDGEEIQGTPPHRVARRGVGRTFQVVRPFRKLDVTTNVLSGLGVADYPRTSAFWRTFGGRAGQARGIAGRVGLSHRLRAPSGELPIGLLRRLEIGRAIALSPTAVLLDEPAAGLTSEEVGELDEVVRRLAAEGRAVILVEHNMQFAMRVCDRIVVLASGQVLAEGTPEDVRRDPKVVEVYLGRSA